MREEEKTLWHDINFQKSEKTSLEVTSLIRRMLHLNTCASPIIIIIIIIISIRTKSTNTEKQ